MNPIRALLRSSVCVLLCSSVAIVLCSSAAAFQSAPVDTVPASDGGITIVPINHATLQLRHGTNVIDVDPVSQASFDGLPAPDIILVTDIHGDHLDPAMVDTLKTTKTTVVAPKAAAAKLDGATVMANGETKTVNGVRIEAVPMYNLTRGPSAGKLFHDKGRGNGYILTLGGTRIYIAGDTECTPEMRALTNIDVAFLPMNLPYTMPPSEAAECVKAFKPKIVYPYHYRGQNLEEFASALKGTPIDVRIRDWYSSKQ
jgi:L-ascorbate metabolism protein UlaG (beta-lactamase superfamily)